MTSNLRGSPCEWLKNERLSAIALATEDRTPNVERLFAILSCRSLLTAIALAKEVGGVGSLSDGGTDIGYSAFDSRDSGRSSFFRSTFIFR